MQSIILNLEQYNTSASNSEDKIHSLNCFQIQLNSFRFSCIIKISHEAGNHKEQLLMFGLKRFFDSLINSFSYFYFIFLYVLKSLTSAQLFSVVNIQRGFLQMNTVSTVWSLD